MKKWLNLAGLILLLALFSSSGHSEVYVQGNDYSESDIRLSPHDLYVIPPYNITFNFSGMDEFKVGRILLGPGRMEKEQGKEDAPTKYGWDDEPAEIELETPDRKSSISFVIYRHLSYGPHPEMETVLWKCKNDKNMECNITKVNNITWSCPHYQDQIEVELENRPIPRNGSYRFEGIPETSHPPRTEIININFENIPKVVVDQFISSLNITGLGKGGIEKTENWDDYVARMRKPNDHNGYKPSISALVFIDMLYSRGIHYDPKTGALDIPIFLQSNRPHLIEEQAIEFHYWGPIPLPKNVSLASPNGE